MTTSTPPPPQVQPRRKFHTSYPYNLQGSCEVNAVLHFPSVGDLIALMLIGGQNWSYEERTKICGSTSQQKGAHTGDFRIRQMRGDVESFPMSSSTFRPGEREGWTRNIVSQWDRVLVKLILDHYAVKQGLACYMTMRILNNTSPFT